MPDRAYDRNRLKNLIHYVIWAAGSHPKFGATKLYKIAWFADARRYMLSGQSITGAPYIRETHGPIPRDGMSIRNQLVSEGAIQQWEDRVYDKPVWRFKLLQKPDQHWFSEAEKADIDYWIKHIVEDHTAESISDETHDYAWQIAKMKEPLPFTALLASRIREPNEEERKRHLARAKQLGLM